MVDPNEHELAAMAMASDAAGAFIDSLGKTDMARWTPQQWHQFIETICGGYVDHLCELQAKINASLAKVQA
jgi:hypothetical protein